MVFQQIVFVWEVFDVIGDRKNGEVAIFDTKGAKTTLLGKGGGEFGDYSSRVDLCAGRRDDLPADSGGDDRSDAGRLRLIYETITSKLPDAGESAALLRAVGDLRTMYEGNTVLAEQLCEGLLLDESVSPAELAAWTVLVSTVYNLDITKTRE